MKKSLGAIEVLRGFLKSEYINHLVFLLSVCTQKKVGKVFDHNSSVGGGADNYHFLWENLPLVFSKTMITWDFDGVTKMNILCLTCLLST